MRALLLIAAMTTVGFAVHARGAQDPIAPGTTSSTGSVTGDAFVAGVGPATRRMRIAIGSDGGSIRVNVRDRAGASMSNMPVLVLDARAASVTTLASGIVAVGQTDDTGSFVAESLVPGAYMVLATHDLPPYVVGAPTGGIHIERSPEALRQLLQMSARGQRVTVGPNARAEVSLQP